ncbi:MAG: hypothetical protein AAF628_20850 [Planctomycetota bacterium]
MRDRRFQKVTTGYQRASESAGWRDAVLDEADAELFDWETDGAYTQDSGGIATRMAEGLADALAEAGRADEIGDDGD